MRIGLSRWAAIGLTALGFAIGPSHASAQQYYPQPGYPATSPLPVSAADTFRAPDVGNDAMQQRIDQLEREMKELRQQSGARVTTISTSNGAAAEEVNAAGCKIKKVDLITKPNFQIIGRIQAEADMFETDGLQTVSSSGAFTPLVNEYGFRRARLGARGYLYENVYGKIEVEFQGTQTIFRDVYIELQNLGATGWNFRVGNFKEPMALEELTGDENQTFMEKSVAGNLYGIGRHFGVMAYNYLFENQDLCWFVGTFANNFPQAPTDSGMFKENTGDWCFDARLAWNPWYDEPSNGRYLSHLAGSYSYRTSTATDNSFTTKQELGDESGFLRLVTPNDRNWSQAGLEAAIVSGPFSLQGEYYAWDTGDLQFNGAYLMASYFLTGESRGYNRQLKIFDAVKPFTDFFCVRTCDGVCKGSGAWEIAARVDYMQLDGAGFGPAATVGDQTDFALALNWYLNQYTRVWTDYVYNDVNQGALHGNPSFFGMRMSITF